MAEKAMRLSEAIRLGAVLRPQAFGSFLNVSDGSTCAAGAAMEAIGELKDGNISEADIKKYFPATGWLVADPYPEDAGEPAEPLIDVIFHMNDGWRWTREKIADWVERLENERTGNERAPDRTGVPAEEPVTA